MRSRTRPTIRLRGALLAVAAASALTLAAPGTGWADTIPLPPDASANGPNATTAPSDYSTQAISCPAAGACTAVGTYMDQAGHRELLLLDQTAGAWKATEGNLSALATAPGGLDVNGFVYPTAIACPTAGNCVAAGFYYNAAGVVRTFTVAEVNASWQAPAPAPAPASTASAPRAFPSSIACTTTADCVVIGNFVHSNTINDYQGFVLSESGGSWSAQTVTLPAGAATGPDVWLDSVSCTSTGNCVAVGQYALSGGGQAGLLLTETAGSWSASRITPTGVAPALSVPETMEIGDVLQNSSGGGTLACPSAGTCVAVADYTDVHGYKQGLILVQHGSSWTDQNVDSSQLNPAIRTISGNPAPQTVLSSVACTSPGNCTALGSYLDSTTRPQGMVMSEVGGAWQPAKTVPLPADANATDVNVWPSQMACAAAGNCAGGFQYDATGSPVTMQEGMLTGSNGAWSTNEIALPGSSAFATNYGWSDVACAAGGYCASLTSYAVGTASSLAVVSSSAPAAPGVQASSGAPGAGTATVTWSAPASGGLPVSGYTVTAADQTHPAAGGQTASVAGGTLSTTVTGLTVGDAYTFTVTATNALGLGLGGTSAAVTVRASDAAGGSTTTNVDILASLERIVVPTGKPSRLRAIRKAHGYTFTYDAPVAGRLTIAWYRVTGTRKQPRRTLVAAANAKLTRAGRARIAVKLTGAGRRLLASSHRLKLVAALSFTPTGGEPVRKSGGFTLH